MKTDDNTDSNVSLLGVVIWILAALFFLYEFFLRTSIGSIADQVIHDLQLNAGTFTVLGTSYYYAYGLMQIPVGALTDKFGVKLITVIAILICAGATFLFATSFHFYSALISRLLMGFGSSFAFVCLLVVVATWFPRKNFGFLAGVSQFIGTMGPFLAGGPLVALMDGMHGNWRAALSIIAAVGVILSLLVLTIYKNKPPYKQDALIYLEREISLKVRLRNLLTNKQAWTVALYSGAVYFSLEFLATMWGTLYLQARGLTQQEGANVISMAWIGYAIGCPLLGAISDYFCRRKPVLVGCVMLGLLACLIFIYINLSHHVWLYGLCLFCIGFSASGQNLGFATIAEHVDLASRATAMGLNNTSIILTAGIVPFIASHFIKVSTGGTQAGLAIASNYIGGFTIMPILYSIALISSIFFIKETYCRPQREMISPSR